MRKQRTGRSQARLANSQPRWMAVMFTDIVSSTAIRDACVRQSGEVSGETRYRTFQTEHNSILDTLISTHQGRVFSTAGDAYHVEFSDARRAVMCAVEIQRTLADRQIPPPVRTPRLPPYLQLTIGIHVGLLAKTTRAGKSDWDGHTLNAVARIQGRAKPEQILASQEAWARAGRMSGVTHQALGSAKIRGFKGGLQIVHVRWRHASPSHTSAGTRSRTTRRPMPPTPPGVTPTRTAPRRPTPARATRTPIRGVNDATLVHLRGFMREMDALWKVSDRAWKFVWRSRSVAESQFANERDHFFTSYWHLFAYLVSEPRSAGSISRVARVQLRNARAAVARGWEHVAEFVMSKAEAGFERLKEGAKQEGEAHLLDARSALRLAADEPDSMRRAARYEDAVRLAAAVTTRT